MNAEVGYSEFRRKLLEYYQARSPAALGKMRYILDQLEVQGMNTTADLTTALAARFVQSRGPAANANTTRGYVSYLKAACSFAADEGWLVKPPNWKRVTPAPAPPVRRKALKPDDVRRILDRLERGADTWKGQRIYALTVLVSHTGLRIREALYLHVSDLDLDQGYLDVKPRCHRLKTSASADTVPLPGRAVDVLRAWAARVDGPWLFPGTKGVGPWTGGEYGRRSIDVLRAAGLAEGVPWISWHSLRHTYATTAVRQWGVPLWAVQRILRHTTARTTEIYLDRGADLTQSLVDLVRDADYRTP